MEKQFINIDEKKTKARNQEKKYKIKMKANRIYVIIKKALKAHHHFGQSIIKNQNLKIENETASSDKSK